MTILRALFSSATILGTAGTSGWYNAKVDGNAKGDGSTDDTAALNAAGTAAFSAGLGLFIPAGNYQTSGPINWVNSANGHVYVRGELGQTYINCSSRTANVITIGNGTGPSTLDAGYMEGIHVTGPGLPSATSNGQIGILLNEMPHFVVRNCNVLYTDQQLRWRLVL